MNWTQEDDELARSEGWFVYNGAFHLIPWKGRGYILIGQLLNFLDQHAHDNETYYKAFMETRWTPAFNQLAERKKYTWAIDGGSWIRGTFGPYQTQEELFNNIQTTANQGCMLSKKAIQVLSSRKLKGK